MSKNGRHRWTLEVPCSRNKVAVSEVKRADREREKGEGDTERRRKEERTENCGQEMEPVRVRFTNPRSVLAVAVTTVFLPPPLSLSLSFSRYVV
ncbi:hypothetical protein PUN28_006394 [Cardiocondyla obscurior]|uniref:Uncharacterized protein n=1 Tax=Cardiocondyla obscurior TaxID=286306 RepID=A0AAW2GBB7_9HYME